MNLKGHYRKLFVGQIRKVREWKRLVKKLRPGKQGAWFGVVAVGWGLGVGAGPFSISRIQDLLTLGPGDEGFGNFSSGRYAWWPVRGGADHSSLRFLGVSG